MTIHSKEIERVHQCKFLGVVIDEKLSWKEHIQRVRNKLCKCLGIMYRAKCKLNLKSLQSLYYALFLPYINYCLEIWGSTHVSKLECLNILQKRAIRLICNKNRKDHTLPLYYQLKIVKFYDLVQLKVCTVIHKAKLKLLRKKLEELINLEINNNCTRNRNKFKLKFARTSIKAKCISTNGVVLYNTLPDSLKNHINVKSFTKNYKCIIIENYITEE